MNRYLLRALPAVFALLVSSLAQSASDGPSNPSLALRASGIQDFVFLAEARPLLIRLHVRVDGKPLPDAYDAFMKHLYAYLDVNGDGVLNQQEAERAPKLGKGNAGLGGFIDGGSPSIKELDTNKDSKVSLAELSAHYRKMGFESFQFQLDLSPPPPNPALALYTGGARPDPEVAAVSKAIFALLDTNKDGKLTQQELDAAPSLLLARDENEDEIITMQELVPEEKPKGNVLAAMMAPMSGSKAAEAGKKFLVPIAAPGQAPAELVGRMQERYDPSAKKPSLMKAAAKSADKGRVIPAPNASKQAVAQDTKPAKEADKGKAAKPEPVCKLSRKQLGLDETMFARLDANKDGVLDNKELAAFVQRDPDLCLVVSFGTKAGKPLDLAAVAGRPAALADKIHVEDAVGFLDLGATRLELRRGEDKNLSNRYIEFVKPQFSQLFKSADKDNNGYLDEKEAKKGRIFGNIFKQMDRDGDGKVYEKEMLAYFDNLLDLGKRASAACVTLVLRDQSRGLFDMLDSNRDGKLSVREIKQAPKLLVRLDRQGKGYVKREDIPPSYQLTLRRGQAQSGRGGDEEIAERIFGDYKEEVVLQRGPAWFRKMDRNRDGDVSRKEFLFSDERFRKLDSDGDGLISLEEAEKAGELSHRSGR